MRAKAFLQTSLGVLALALAYAVGARGVGAQATDQVAGVAQYGGDLFVVATNGDVWMSSSPVTVPYRFVTNVFAGGATPAERASLGQVRSRWDGR